MSASDTPHWHILGAGAIGRLWACHLQQANVPVTLLLRDPHRLAEYSGTVVLDGQTAPQAIKINAQLVSDQEPIRRLLVTTKSYDCINAIKSVQSRISPDASIVLLQNGMGQQQKVAKLLPQINLYAGTTTEGAFTGSGDSLTHAGRGETWIGPFNTTAANQGKQPLQQLLSVLTSNYDPQIIRRLWQKVAINAAINGLTAKFNCRNGELVTNTDYGNEMRKLCLEIETLAKQLQLSLFDRPLYEQACLVAQATANNFSSMLVDVRNSTLTEIDFINGFICQEAHRNGLSLPSNEALTDEIRSHHPIATRTSHG